MRAYFTPHFQRSYHKLPKKVQAVFDKKLTYLLRSIHHPSLRVKKFDEARNVWQARITGSYRAYFEIKDGVFIFHEVKSHED